jgi:hypothetical protein
MSSGLCRFRISRGDRLCRHEHRHQLVLEAIRLAIACLLAQHRPLVLAGVEADDRVGIRAVVEGLVEPFSLEAVNLTELLVGLAFLCFSDSARADDRCLELEGEHRGGECTVLGLDLNAVLCGYGLESRFHFFTENFAGGTVNVSNHGVTVMGSGEKSSGYFSHA